MLEEPDGSLSPVIEAWAGGDARMNDGGWAEQMLNVERHVSTPR